MTLSHRRCGGRNCCLKTLAFLSSQMHHKTARIALCHISLFPFLLLKPLNLMPNKAPGYLGIPSFPPRMKNKIIIETFWFSSFLGEGDLKSFITKERKKVVKCSFSNYFIMSLYSFGIIIKYQFQNTPSK